MTATPVLDPRPVWIDHADALADACAVWRDQDIVGLDTEFVRERTFFPGLGLVQVAVGDPDDPRVALVDTVAINDLAPLAELLADPSVTKVMHAPGEDLITFHHRLEALPTPLFDTQIAAAVAGYGWAMGLGSLVEAKFGVSLPKGAQRTDWLRRPLSAAQLRYAALDAAYLPALYQRLRRQLEDRDRVDWALEDSARLADELPRQLPAAADAWRKVKGAGRLRPLERGTLEALAAWRERTARARDLARGFVLPDAALVALARHRPADAGELASVRELPPAARRRHGSRLLRVIAEAEPSQHTPPSRPAYDPRPLVRALQQAVAEHAHALDVPTELLASRRILEALLRRVEAGDDEPLPAPLRGWRAAVIGEAVTERARTVLAGATDGGSRR